MRYLLTASNGKGHGIHSPFVFDFVTKVLNDKEQPPVFENIESLRKKWLADKTVIAVEDFGAGSSVIKTKKRVVADIAASSLKPKKYAQLLHRMVKHYLPLTTVELGTSFGITSSYMATGDALTTLYTFEGSENIANIAAATFEQLGLINVTQVRGDFGKTLAGFIESKPQVDLCFLDGNHRKQPTLDYFNTFLNVATPKTIFVFDDIHWSKEMEEAWNIIKQHNAVTLTIDLFFIGIVVINPDIKVKQHFTIRY